MTRTSHQLIHLDVAVIVSHERVRHFAWVARDSCAILAWVCVDGTSSTFPAA